MARIPNLTRNQITATSVGMLNTIRDNAPDYYQAGVPLADETTASIRAVGDAILAYQPRQNYFVNALVNRIGMEVISSRAYTNPWAMFKRGIMDVGETIEEIFIDIAKPFQYDPDDAQTTLYKRVPPNVASAFHTLNYQKHYDVTIQEDDLRQAFTSMNGVSRLIQEIIRSCYDGAEYDEFLMMKYQLYRLTLDGKVIARNVPELNSTNARAITTAVKAISDDLTFRNPHNNYAGVRTFTPRNDQYVIKSTDANALLDVEVLSLAFNMSRSEFMGHQVLVDSIDNWDSERIAELLDGDPGFVPFTEEEIEALKTVHIWILDKNWWMIYDYLFKMKSAENGKGLYENYFLHVWKIISSSPFNQAVAFTTMDPTPTAVTVTPSPASVVAGGNITLFGTVSGTGFFDKAVTYELDTSTPVTSEQTAVNPTTGYVTVGANETATTFNVLVRSVANPSVFATVPINIFR